jgi:hypothetical protein
MAAGSTYTPIATTTLGSAVSSYTFSSISGSYTDLILVIQGTWSGVDYEAVALQFNGDTGANYSRTLLTGNGTAASSSRESTSNWGALGIDQSNNIFHIMNYSNSTTYKTVVSRASSSAYQVRATVGLWRSTSAITSVLAKMASGNFNSGTTLTLYGIAAA